MVSLSSHPARLLARAALAGLVVACIGAGPALAAEAEGPWPQFQGGAAHPGMTTEGPAPPYVERWRFSPDGGALSGAVLTDRLAIAVGEQAVYAIELDTGSLAWEIPRDTGPLSVPALGNVGDRRVLLYLEGPAGATGDVASPSPTPSPSPGANDGASTTSDLVAVDLADRTELWRRPLAGASRSGVTVDGERAFVGDDDGRVYAVAIDTGKVVWTGEAIGRVDAPPAVADGMVYVAGRDVDGARAQVVALEETGGDRAWAYAPQAGAAAISGISVADATVVFGAADRLVRGLATGDGSIRWDALTLTLFSPVSAPAFAPGTDVYVADASGGLYRIDAGDGSRVWEHQTNELIVRSSPVLVGDHLVVGLGDGRLAAFDAATGDLVAESSATPGLIGTIALGRDVLVAVKGGADAGLIAFEHDASTSLVRIPSPTVPDPALLVGGFVVGATIAGALILIPFWLLRSRFTPAFSREEDGDAEGDEP